MTSGHESSHTDNRRETEKIKFIGKKKIPLGKKLTSQGKHPLVKMTKSA